MPPSTYDSLKIIFYHGHGSNKLSFYGMEQCQEKKRLVYFSILTKTSEICVDVSVLESMGWVITTCWTMGDPCHTDFSVCGFTPSLRWICNPQISLCMVFTWSFMGVQRGWKIWVAQCSQLRSNKAVLCLPVSALSVNRGPLMVSLVPCCPHFCPFCW